MLKTKSSFKRSLTNIVAASLVGLSSLLPTYNSNAVTERLNIVSNLFNQTSYQDQKLAIERLYPPTGVLASDGVYNDKVRLTWNASSGASGYQSWRNTTDNSLSATQIGNTSQLIYDDTNIVHGVKYYYWVKATNEDGGSSFSNLDEGYAKATVKDYDNENKSDLAVYNSGYWSIYSLENGIILNNAGVWGGADWTPID